MAPTTVGVFNLFDTEAVGPTA